MEIMMTMKDTIKINIHLKKTKQKFLHVIHNLKFFDKNG